MDLPAPALASGVPAQLLNNRPDIKRAFHELTALKLDEQVAKAEFYPSLGISAGAGIRAFHPSFFSSYRKLFYLIWQEI